MKKIILVLLIFLSIESFGQFPNKQSVSSATTEYLFKGGIKTDKGLINAIYDDTASANADYIDYYTGAQIYTRSDGNFWIRDTLPMRWSRIARYQELGVFADENFAENNLTATADRTHDFADFFLKINNLSELEIKSSLSTDRYSIITDSKPFFTGVGLYSQFNAADAAGLYVSNTNGGSNVFAEAYSQNSTDYSSLYIFPDSIAFFPDNGAMYIDSLRMANNDTAGYKPMVYNIHNKSLRYFNSWGELGLGGGAGGHTIKEEGTPLTNRAGLNFIGLRVTASDDAGNDETDITITADGLDEVLAVGQALTANRSVPTSAFSLTFNSSNTVGTILANNSSTGTSLSGINSSSGIGVWAESATGMALYVFNSGTRTANQPTAEIDGNWASTNSNERILYLTRSTTGTAADGISGSIDFLNETHSPSSLVLSSRIISGWSTADNTTRTGFFAIQGVNNGAAPAEQLRLKGTGQLQLNNYGSGTFTGTDTKWLAVDASGNIIEENPPSGSGTVTDFIFTDANGFDGTVTTSTTTPTLSLTTTVANTHVMYSNNGAIVGSANLTYNASLLSSLSASLGVTQDDTKGIVLINNTAAAAGAQQISPALRWSGQGWKTNATAASQEVEFRSYVLPVEGTSAPFAEWLLESSINAAAYVQQFAVTSAGSARIGSGGTIPSNISNSLTFGTGIVGSNGGYSIAMNGSTANNINAIVLAQNATSNAANTFISGQNSVIASGANGASATGADHNIGASAPYAEAHNDANDVYGESAFAGGFGNDNYVANGFVMGNSNVLGALTPGGGTANQYTDAWAIGTQIRTTGHRNGSLGYYIQTTGRNSYTLGSGIVSNGTRLNNGWENTIAFGTNSDSATVLILPAEGTTGTYGDVMIRGIGQDDTETRIMVVQSDGLLQWRDVATIGGLITLNTLSGATQTFSTATTGTDFTINSSGTNHEFAIPSASATARGLVTTGTQTFGGSKTITGSLTIEGAWLVKDDESFQFWETPVSEPHYIAGGTWNLNYKNVLQSDDRTITANNSWANNYFKGDAFIISEASSGTHRLIANTIIQGVKLFGTAGAGVTYGATLYIPGTAELTNGNAVIDNNYAMWIDSGAVRMDGVIYLEEQAAPGTPSSGLFAVYVKTDGKIYGKNDAGTEYDLTAGGGSGGHTIKEEGTPLTNRAGLNFVGAGITASDDAGNDETDVTLDADLNTIAGLAATTDNFIVSVSSAWASRTPAEVKTTLSLNNVTNDAQLVASTTSTQDGYFGTIKLKDVTNPSHYLTIRDNEDLSADRTLNIITGNADRTLTFTGDASISGTNTGDQTSVSGNAGTATTLQTSRNIWGQAFNGSADVTGSLSSVGDITGGASSMIITAGTGNSRTMTLRSTTAGGTATAFLTGNADQSTTFGGNISGTGSWTLTGGAGNMTIISGTGASRTMILQTTTSGSAATTALTLNADQTATFASSATATSFIPSASTVPSNGMYLPAANTVGWAANSAIEMQLTSTALSPGADGGSSLGTTALGWQNLFGNTGFVVNIENGNWVATHTSGILTVGTGDLRVTTAGTNTASVVTVGGTQTLTGKSIDAGQLTGTIATARMTNIKQAKGITIISPTASENATIWYTTQAITIEEVRGVMLGSSQSVTLVVNYGSSRGTADGTIVASNTFDSGDSGYQTTGFAFTLNTTSIPAGSYIWLTTSATSGTINDLNLTITYRQ